MRKRFSAAMALALSCAMVLTACSGGSKPAETTAAGAAEAAKDGEKKVLKVAMECAYAPYNWTQPDDSNGAVPRQQLKQQQPQQQPRVVMPRS